jgi:hypothetical protein
VRTGRFTGGTDFGEHIGKGANVLTRWSEVERRVREKDAAARRGETWDPLGILGQSTHGATKNNRTKAVVDLAHHTVHTDAKVRVYAGPSCAQMKPALHNSWKGKASFLQAEDGACGPSWRRLWLGSWRLRAGKHSNESHDSTTFKTILPDVWGIALASGNMVLLLQFLTAIWNLAMPESCALGKGVVMLSVGLCAYAISRIGAHQRHLLHWHAVANMRSFPRADLLKKEIENLDVGALSAEMMKMVDLSTTRSVVKLGYMDMNSTGQKRSKLLETERMEVVRVPSALLLLSLLVRLTHRHQHTQTTRYTLCLNQASKVALANLAVTQGAVQRPLT